MARDRYIIDILDRIKGQGPLEEGSYFRHLQQNPRATKHEEQQRECADGWHMVKPLASSYTNALFQLSLFVSDVVRAIRTVLLKGFGDMDDSYT